MDNKIKKNYFFNAFNQLLSLITPFITAPYLSRVLKADGIGTYSYNESLVSYFVLFASLGLALYGQREISYWQQDKKGRSKAFWETFLLSVVSSLISLIAFFFFIGRQENKILLLILSLNIVSCIVDISWFFHGMENFKLVSVRNFIFKLVNIVYIFLFVKSKSDLPLYALGICGFSFLNYVSLWFALPKYISFIPLKDLKPFRRLPSVISLFVPTIAIQVYTVLDKTMIGAITQDAFQNGYYEQAVKMTRMVLSLITSLGTVMMSRIGSYFSNNETVKVKDSLYKSYQFVWFLAVPLAFGLSSVSSSFVPWFYGQGYEEVIPLLHVLSFLIVVIGISNVTGIQYLIPVGKQRQYTISVISGACVNFALNALLIPRYAAFGAAVASLIAEISVTGVQLFLVHKELSVYKILKTSSKYVIAGITMVAIIAVENKFLEPLAVSTIIMVASGAIIYFSVLFILKDDMIKSIFSKEKEDNV